MSTRHSARQTEDSCLQDFFTLELHEPGLTGDNLGLKTWGSSLVLAERLHTLLLPGSTNVPLEVLELGSGTGLLGLAAAGVWSADVTLTDLPAIVPNLRNNAVANMETLNDVAPAARLSCGILDWNDPRDLNIAISIEDKGCKRERDHKFSVLLAADPIYSEEHPALFTQTVFTWLAREHKARLLLAYPLRDLYGQEFDMLRRFLQEGGLEVVQEGEELRKDDWTDDVLHCWSVWSWSQPKIPDG